jgi:hypothetical protein
MFKHVLILFFVFVCSISFSQQSPGGGGSGFGEGFAEVQFFFRVDDQNRITSVLDKFPVYQPRPTSLPASMTWQTESEFTAYVSAFQALPIHAHSDLWDECKRCPADKEGIPRFLYDETTKSIIPAENVANIDVPSGFSISEKGVLRPM